jgi:low affinity Fe/Cu permease
MNKLTKRMSKYLSTVDLIVIIITFLLFITALFVKGLTQDILIEAGVLLISIKIIVMNYKIAVSNKAILEKLDEIRETMREKANDSK